MNWLFIIFALVTQEVISLNTVILEVHRYNFHVGLIHILFMAATALDIIVGFTFGTYAKKHLTNKKLVAFAEKWSARFYTLVGKKGKWVALIILGNFSFPYINAFIAPWLNLSFIESFIFIFIGNMIWYATVWLFVLGVVSVVPNPLTGLFVIIAIVILVMLFAKKFTTPKV